MGNPPRCFCKHLCHKGAVGGWCRVELPVLEDHEMGDPLPKCECRDCCCPRCEDEKAKMYEALKLQRRIPKPKTAVANPIMLTAEKAIIAAEAPRKPVVLCFYEWGSVCWHHHRQEFYEFARRWRRRLVFFRCEILENPSVVERFELGSDVTTCVFHRGRELVRFVDIVEWEKMAKHVGQRMPRLK